MTITSLDKLDINKYGTIASLDCKGDLRRRLLDLGLVTRNSPASYSQKSNRKSHCLWSKRNYYCLKKRRF